jgi:cytochrome d ubiquinol oxidase subunit II
VLGIGILLIALPKAHGVVLQALYLPVALMLIGLVLRGVAFDFRVKAKEGHKATWDRLFFAGSAIASSPRAGCSGATSAASARAGTTRFSPPAIALALADGLRAHGRLLAGDEERGRAAGEGDRLGPARLACRSSPAWC